MPLPPLSTETWARVFKLHEDWGTYHDFCANSLVARAFRPLAQKHVWSRIKLGFLEPKEDGQCAYDARTQRLIDRLTDNQHLAAYVVDVEVGEWDRHGEDGDFAVWLPAETLFRELFALLPAASRWHLAPNLDSQYPALYRGFFAAEPPADYLYVGGWTREVQQHLAKLSKLQYFSVFWGLTDFTEVDESPVPANPTPLQTLHFGKHQGGDEYALFVSIAAASHASLRTLSSHWRSFCDPAIYSYLHNFTGLRVLSLSLATNEQLLGLVPALPALTHLYTLALYIWPNAGFPSLSSTTALGRALPPSLVHLCLPWSYSCVDDYQEDIPVLPALLSSLPLHPLSSNSSSIVATSAGVSPSGLSSSPSPYLHTRTVCCGQWRTRPRRGREDEPEVEMPAEQAAAGWVLHKRRNGQCTWASMSVEFN
ncbi:hypothetical protein JCM8097_008318 [Rhodosporidiobolus ruineniae]